MTLEEFKKLKTVIEKDLTLTKENVLLKNIEIPKLYSKYLDIFSILLKKYKSLFRKSEILYKNKYHYYKYDFKYDLKNKSEIDLYVEGDKDYIELKKQVDESELMLKYVEKTLNNINTMSYNIKNFIEYTKFLNGE